MNQGLLSHHATLALTAHPVPQVVLQDGDRRRWLAFRAPETVLCAHAAGEVLEALRVAQQAVEAGGMHAAGFLAYEAAPAFDRALRTMQPRQGLPLLWLGLFPPPEVLATLPEARASCELGVWQPAVQRDSYRQTIASIKGQIARGNTYQVNFTFPLVAGFSGDPWGLFVRLAGSQQARYAAYVDTGRHVVCSASPELFFHLAGGVLTSRPMKGTAPRGLTLADDEAQRAWLRSSEKNRSENVMIVDMIRNDMGRIAETGSVHVPRLFEVERYPTVLQMTSTVVSRTAASPSQVLGALFPCASITGAPKVSTMGIIAGLEPAPRGVYTGAIGYLAPGSRAQFNVAIRTVLVDRQNGQATYGVGSGVVWDSDADEEYDECLLKARVLSARPADFDLLETILWTPEDGYFLLDRHLRRLAESAEYFGVAVDLPRIDHELSDLAGALPAHAHRVRLLVDQEGVARIEAQPLHPTPGPLPLRIGLAPGPIDRGDVFLYHKTTRRDVYEAARLARPDCDDVLLWNEQGEIAETCVANVAVRLGGELVTPPVACGLLAGTLRSHLLAQGRLREQVITVKDLPHCDGIYVLNSVRGMRPATLIEPVI